MAGPVARYAAGLRQQHSPDNMVLITMLMAQNSQAQALRADERWWSTAAPTLNTEALIVWGGYKDFDSAPVFEVPPVPAAAFTDAATPLIGHDDDVDEVEIDMEREELKVHLENQERKVDARLMSFEQTVKDAMGEIRLEMSHLGGDLKAVERDLGHLKDLKSSMRNTSLAIVSAIIGSAIAIYFGIQSSNTSLVSSTIAGFGVGKDVASAQAAMTQQARDTQEILRQIQEQQKQLQQAIDSKRASPPVSDPSRKG